MNLIAIFGLALAIEAASLAAEIGTPAASATPEFLAALTRKVRPDFLLGSFASGLEPNRREDPSLADFFRRNFNIMTVGIYMTGTQRGRDAFNFENTDALIQFAERNHLQVYLHPMIGGSEYTPKWVNEGGFSAEALHRLMRERITTILTRYQGRIHYVDVVNESLTGKGRKPDGQFEWQERAYRGGAHVWFQTLGMYQGKKHQFPRYLVEAFRIAREVGGPGLKLILNEWGNETTKSPRGHAFLALIQALKEEGIPVDGAGLQLHCRLKDGQLHGWANNQPFDFDAFDAMLKLYAQAGIEAHITEFDIHLGANPTSQDFELQGKYYAEILRHALQAPAVKSFKTWGFTDRHSWKADGIDGHPLLLDENLQPKPAYLRQVEMLRSLAPEASKSIAPSPPASQPAPAPPKGADSVFWPEDSGYVNVKTLGAVGDGKTDDTLAIQRAYAGKNRAVYFPPGTYLVSDTITATPKRYFIQGAGPGRTVIRLKDHCPGFDDPSRPKAVLQYWDQRFGTGSNGQGFRNSYGDLAVEIGVGNRGAIGILYFLHNLGTHVRCTGGLFWVLGLKTEKAGAIVEVTGGGQAEILGGYIYRNRGRNLPDGTTPNAFINFEASLSVCGIAGDSSVEETRGGQNRTGSIGGGLYVGRK